MLTIYRCYNPGCGHRSVLGARQGDGEALCGVVYASHAQGILCKQCLKQQAAAGTVKSWQPLSRFLKVQRSFEGLIRQEIEIRDAERRRKHEHEQARARKKKKQSEWRQQLARHAVVV